MKQGENLYLIDEICREKGIEESFLSFGWIRELRKDGKICHIVRNSFDLNPASCYHIVNDKYATYEVLKHHNISVLTHYMIFNPKAEGRGEFAGNLNNEVDEIFKKINQEKVVVKANTSSEGKQVFIATSEEEAVTIIKTLFKENFLSVSICPFEEIECEYRVVFLDNEILYVYKKIARDWKHNLADGAYAITDLKNDEKLEAVKELALKAGKAVNARFVTIDISKRVNGEIFVMEINGAVCMSKFIEMVPNGRQIAQEIYEKAIDKMFDK